MPLVPEASVRPGDPGEVARERSVDGWVLVADGGQPLGWLAVDRVGAQVDIADLALGGTLARQGGPLRAALDAALSSPSGRGVVVGDQGELLGTVRARDVIDVIEGSRGGSGVQDTPAPGVLP
ncbi:Glycine betaine/L-proline transport ATP binding subunit (fragment) [Nostocoides australiense Ben110]|uniref:Glycine betaine/L-proline transport ATP binding subunit n=1 Tax=Nostocoides australiense Ben110 TaxID=1193182 RepID=W6JY35_9MICO